MSTTNIYREYLGKTTSIDLPDVDYASITLLNDLQGHWWLQRRLGEWGTMWADAAFSQLDNSSLHYHEAGYVYFNHTSKRYKASKSQLYTYDQKNLLIRTYDAASPKKGILLHTLDLSTSALTQRPIYLQSEYTCKEDTYQLEWVLVNSHHLQLNYLVQGPFKSYTIQTTLLKR